MQRLNGCFSSYVGAVGITDLLDVLIDGDEMLFEGQSEVDHLHMENDDWYLYVQHSIRKVPIVVRYLLESSSLIWTHERPSVLSEIGKERALIYMIRDGRAVVNSLMHHVTRPNVRARHKRYKIDDPIEMYKQLGVFRKYVQLWHDHVRDYMSRPEGLILVRFEDLVSDMSETCEHLAKTLGFNCDTKDVAETFSFRRMKQDSPAHLRSDRQEDWTRYYGAEHRKIFDEVAGSLLLELGYIDEGSSV
ncbi:MAG: hypothetical protein ACI841_000515 [Planctomycetota bacterium]|jgi:hypothetical protein